MQGQQNEVLLTNSPCVGWLCKVFWHLPVDVKPEKGKVTAIKQVEYFNTFHVPTGMNDAERFSIQLSNSIFSVCRRMWKGKTKQKKKSAFSSVQLCNCSAFWLQFPEHFPPPPSASLSWIFAIWAATGAREEVTLDKFTDHRKRKTILYRLLNIIKASQKIQGETTYIALRALYPTVAKDCQYQSQKSRCWGKKPTLGHWIHRSSVNPRSLLLPQQNPT